MPNLFVGPKCGTCFMPLLTPTIFRWFSNFWKICAPLWYCKCASTLHAMITLVTLLLQLTKQKWQQPTQGLQKSYVKAQPWSIFLVEMLLQPIMGEKYSNSHQ